MKARIASALSFALLGLSAVPAVAQNQAWIRQIGTSASEAAQAAAADGSGGVFVTGYTDGSLAGPNAGNKDVWIARYYSAGNQAWIRQLGASQDDYAYAAAPDGSGGVYVSGLTLGSLGGPTAGAVDAWLARHDSAGNLAWIRQIGTNADDQIRAAAPDTSGGVYVTGHSNGTLGGPILGNFDAWLARYDGAGNQTWIRQFGTSLEDYSRTAAPDGSGGVFVAGSTYGNPGGQNAGNADVWVARFDSTGGQAWLRQIGTSQFEHAYASAPDGSGGVYVGGYTSGSLGGPSAGNADAWLAHYDGSGNQTWIRQFGTSDPEGASATAADGSGSVYLSGWTLGSLGGPSAGSLDAWLSLYGGPCSGPSAYCTAGTTVHGCVPAIYSGGTPSSVSNSGFDIIVDNVPGERYGTIFYGFYQVAVPWAPASPSVRCVSYPLQRMGILDSAGTPGLCDGEFRLDFNAWYQGHLGAMGSPFAPGQVFHAQAWFRDPGAPKQTNLSDALRFTLCN